MTETQSLTEAGSNPEGDVWRPPYVAYTTLASFIDNKLGTNPLPPRIDRGFLDSYAGSVQAMLLSALRLMGFIGEEGQVLEPLKEATRSPALRKKVFRAWAEEFYGDQQVLARQNATAQMLHESFSRHRLSGSTLRKAVVFYLALVEDVGMEKSPHFKAPKQPSPSASRSTTKKKPTPEPLVEKAKPQAAGETIVIDLAPAGTVTVNVDVKWLQLPMETFTKLRSIIADLEALSPKAESETGDDEAEGDVARGSDNE